MVKVMYQNKKDLFCLGNKEILDHYKTAFLCSRKCPSTIFLKSLDWAREQKEEGNCIISGFHSTIERDVFDILIRGEQPIILVLARGMKKRWNKAIKTALKQQRILILSPFDDSTQKITQKTSLLRNRVMVSIADEVLIAYAAEGGNIENILKDKDSKKINYMLG
jgi:predicted Rossmann fold nucleotide-binding protein DprA/Smf involved in DNA uptake